jgi:Sulfatase
VLRQELDYFLQVLGICAFAIAQPVLDVMGKSPETFVFRGASATLVVLFAVAVALLPALALSVLGAGTRVFGSGIRRGFHLAILGSMAAVVVMQVVKMTTSLRDGALLTLALIGGGVLLWLITRVQAVGLWMRWAAAASVAFVLIFLLVSPVSKLLRAPEAGASVRDARRIPVVILVLDELPLASLVDRSGKINADLYPNFADLASRSTWYRNYTATETFTRYAIPTLITGNSVTDRSKDLLAADHPDNLFSLLARSHRLEVFETVTALCSQEQCSGSELQGTASGQERAGLSALLSDALVVWRELSLPGESTRDITTQFAEPLEGGGSADGDYSLGEGPFTAFLNSFSPAEQPTLHYLHVLIPHVPWRVFPSGQAYQILNWRDDLPVVTNEPTRPWIDERWPVQLARERHLLQVQYTDLLLGRLMERLREVGTFDDALVVVTSDHGVGLHPGRERKAATLENMHELYWVPMFIKAPHQERGTVDDRNLMAVDLLPTIADVLGTEVPWRTEGRSALDPSFDRGTTKRIVRHWDEWFSLPSETLSIAQETAQKRIRREAFVPTGGCRQARCAYLVGPAASVIGAPLENFNLKAPSDLSASLTLPHTLRADEGGSIPALVLGNLVDEQEHYDGRIAVAVNGSLAGISETWTQDGVPGWFGVLAPEFLVRPGHNDLRLFEVDGSNLRPISIVP